MAMLCPPPRRLQYPKVCTHALQLYSLFTYYSVGSACTVVTDSDSRFEARRERRSRELVELRIYDRAPIARTVKKDEVVFDNISRSFGCPIIYASWARVYNHYVFGGLSSALATAQSTRCAPTASSNMFMLVVDHAYVQYLSPDPLYCCYCEPFLT
jgi:hypothetical protein